jgi:hypothetical protein
VRYVVAIGAWELMRPLVRRGLILVARWFWEYELRRVMRA